MVIDAGPWPDTIIREQNIKQRIHAALCSKEGKAQEISGIREVTVPIKVMVIPGIDVGLARIIDPTIGPRTLCTEDIPTVDIQIPNASNDWFTLSFPPVFVTGALGGGAIGSSTDGDTYYTAIADTGIRCEKCINSLACSTGPVEFMTCRECKRRYIRYNKVDSKASQLCLGFDWRHSLKAYTCDECLTGSRACYTRPMVGV